MPKIRVVRATPGELQKSMLARDYFPDEPHRQPGRKRPQKKMPEVLQRYPLRGTPMREQA